MSMTNNIDDNPTWKERIRGLPSWVRGGLGGALLFILIGLPFAIAYWVTDEKELLIPLFGLLYTGVPPVLFVMIGALLGSKKKNIVTFLLVFVLFVLLLGACIYGTAIGMYGISG